MYRRVLDADNVRICGQFADGRIVDVVSRPGRDIVQDDRQIDGFGDFAVMPVDVLLGYRNEIGGDDRQDIHPQFLGLARHP
jgi:hypothetical protein